MANSHQRHRLTASTKVGNCIYISSKTILILVANHDHIPKQVHRRQLFHIILRQSRNNCVPLHHDTRRVGRVTECAGLEIRYTPFGYRGFESLTLRKIGEPIQGSPISFPIHGTFRLSLGIPFECLYYLKSITLVLHKQTMVLHMSLFIDS